MTVVHFWSEQLIHIRTDPGLRGQFRAAGMRAPYTRPNLPQGRTHEAGEDASRRGKPACHFLSNTQN